VILRGDAIGNVVGGDVHPGASIDCGHRRLDDASQQLASASRAWQMR
jgi:hypothetical protein